MDLEKYLKKNKDETIIFQKFVENEGDYRVFIIEQDIMYSIKRKSKDDKKEFRNNQSLGGTSEKSEIPKKAMDIAKKASKVMGFDISGVDLIKEKGTDNWYVLEVNSAPQFDWEEKGKESIADYREVLDKFVSIIKSKIS
jgi:ribosomal protein S6--L-glutamate ligase